ncbi:DNA-3-methyladenine glycosylase I [Hyphomonas sp. WL0036]|uniref:DNA-3-methyladenine glycosylase I n=1 Tax=Hyphomonas sediminis TaxID=2866160 RepID=UPI001C80C4FD|nr:DNA-3-methyladenine glycosylase I [Hyphomonas sediminis]MBY9068420.1 DNA-3-methyladenine glycosylase I [Hyphomonas sediminis]
MSDPHSCGWAPMTDALYRAYHDEEWGVPERDPRALWEKLQLDGMQAGLSWITILRKRDSIREEFDGFDPEKLARWTPKRAEKALQNPGIIRSPKKIDAVIGNAQIYLGMMESGEDFSEYCWSFVGGKPIVNKWKHYRDAPTCTDWSEKMSKDLKKRGFKFVGPTIVYAWGQAVGMVNDHEVGCPRHKAVREKA